MGLLFGMQNKSDFQTGFSGMFWMGTTTILNYCIQLIITYFLARLLTPSEYGQVAALTILIGLAELFWMMGVGQAIVQKKDITNEDIITGNTLNVIFGISVFLLINGFAPLLVKMFSISDTMMLRVYSVIFIVNSFSGVSQSLSQKKYKFKRISIIRSFSIVVYGAIAVTLASFHLGPWALVYANSFHVILISILFLIYEPVTFRFGIYKTSVNKLLHFGGGFTIARFFNYLALKGDSFVVNKLMGKSELGLLSRAQQLLMYPVSLIGETLDQVLFPLLSKSKGDQIKLKRVFLNGTGVIALITAPVSIVAFFCAEELIGFFLGDGWTSAVEPFKVLIIGLFFRTGYKLSESLLKALGKVYEGAAIQFLYAIIVIAGAYFGHFYGLSGVALGVTVAFTINYIMLTGLSMYLIKIKLSEILNVLFPSVLYGSLTILVLRSADFLLSNVVNNFITCVVTTVFVFLVYGILFFALKSLTMTKELSGFLTALFLRFDLRRKRSSVTKIV
jgi:PST family polysaccharide transporter